MRQIYNSAESSPEMLRFNMLEHPGQDSVGHSANNCQRQQSGAIAAFVPNCDVHNVLGSTTMDDDCSGDCLTSLATAGGNNGSRNSGRLMLANLMPSRLEANMCYSQRKRESFLLATDTNSHGR